MYISHPVLLMRLPTDIGWMMLKIRLSLGLGFNFRSGFGMDYFIFRLLWGVIAERGGLALVESEMEGRCLVVVG